MTQQARPTPTTELRAWARRLVRENAPLKAWADHEPAPAEEAAFAYLKGMCAAARCRPATLQAAMDRIYHDGVSGPISDKDWFEQDGRLGRNSRERAVRILQAALDVRVPDVEYHDPERLSDGFLCPECGTSVASTETARIWFRCGSCDWEGDEAADPPNATLDGDAARKAFWQFLVDIYGSVRVA